MGLGIRCLLSSVPSWLAVAFLPAVSLPCASVSFMPRGGGWGGTILLRVLAAQLSRYLHRDGVLSVASEIPCSLSVLPSPGNSRKYLHFTNALRLRKEVSLFSFFTSIFEILPQSAMCMVSFWGCRWQEMLESVSVLTFAFPSSAPLTSCCCPVSD